MSCPLKLSELPERTSTVEMVKWMKVRLGNNKPLIFPIKFQTKEKIRGAHDEFLILSQSETAEKKAAFKEKHKSMLADCALPM